MSGRNRKKCGRGRRKVRVYLSARDKKDLLDGLRALEHLYRNQEPAAASRTEAEDAPAHPERTLEIPDERLETEVRSKAGDHLARLNKQEDARTKGSPVSKADDPATEIQKRQEARGRVKRLAAWTWRVAAFVKEAIEFSPW